MPKRLLIAGVLLCIVGLLCIWDAAHELIEGGVSLGLIYWACLPVGIGLLRGKSSALVWASRLIFAGYVICALGAVIAVFSPDNLYVRGDAGKAAFWPFLLGVGLAAVFFAVLHWLLRSRTVEVYLENRRSSAAGLAEGDAGSVS